MNKNKAKKKMEDEGSLSKSTMGATWFVLHKAKSIGLSVIIELLNQWSACLHLTKHHH